MPNWSTLTSATQLTTVTTLQWFNAIITRKPTQEVVVSVDVNFGGTTDDAVVYAQQGLSTSAWDDVYTIEYPILVADGDPRQISFPIHWGHKWRFGVARNSTGATDSHTADMSYLQTST